MTAGRSQRGQASVELLGAVPALLALGLAALQLLAIGYCSVLAGAAAEAGALALAGGVDARAAARDSLPGWSRARARMDVSEGTVRVRLRPPSPLRAVARRFEVTAEASVETATARRAVARRFEPTADATEETATAGGGSTRTPAAP